MNSISSSNGESGFTLVEVLIVTAIISILASTALANYANYQTRARDITAISDYRNLKTAVLDEAFNLTVPDYQFVGLTGPGILPAPLQAAVLSKNIDLIRVSRQNVGSPVQEVIRIELEHVGGAFEYHYTSVDGVVVEQVISN